MPEALGKGLTTRQRPRSSRAVQRNGFMRSLLCSLALPLTGTVACTKTSGSATESDFHIKLVVQANMEDEDYHGAVAFKRYVESQTDGRVAIQIFTGAQLCGSNRECIEALLLGVVEVFMATSGGTAVVFPEIQVLELPYIFPNDEVAEDVLHGSFKESLRSHILRGTGKLRLMTIGNTGGWRCFATTQQAVRGPEDLRGLKIRTVSSHLQMEFTRALGANPTPVAWPEVYTSLATGVVEGTKNGITDIVGMNFHQHIKHVVLDGHAYMAALWWMNNDVYMSLPLAYRRVVDEGFARLREVTLQIPKERDAQARQTFEAAGGTIYVPNATQRAQFQAAAEPMQRWYAAEYGDFWLRKLKRAVERSTQSLAASQTQPDAPKQSQIP